MRNQVVSKALTRPVEKVRVAPIETKIAFVGNYLGSLRTKDAWNDDVLRWINTQFGKPLVGEQQPLFWRGIPGEVRDEYRRWLMERELRDFFAQHGDSGGRFQFWKLFEDHWKEISSSHDHRVLMLDFGEIGVIEFADVGNAAYVYRKEDFDRMVRRSTSSYSSLKDRELTIARIIHREGWQRIHAPIVSKLLRK